MLIKSQRDFWAGLLFVVAGVAFGAHASLQQVGSAAQPGPGYVALILAVALALVGASVLFKALTIETEGGHRIGAPAWRALFAVGAAPAVFAVVVGHWGLIAAVVAAALLASRAGVRGDWRAGWLASCAAAALLALAAGVAAALGWPGDVPLWPTSAR